MDFREVAGRIYPGSQAKWQPKWQRITAWAVPSCTNRFGLVASTTDDPVLDDRLRAEPHDRHQLWAIRPPHFRRGYSQLHYFEWCWASAAGSPLPRTLIRVLNLPKSDPNQAAGPAAEGRVTIWFEELLWKCSDQVNRILPSADVLAQRLKVFTLHDEDG